MMAATMNPHSRAGIVSALLGAVVIFCAQAQVPLPNL
jgi:hypothetical protein